MLGIAFTVYERYDRIALLLFCSGPFLAAIASMMVAESL